uniref:Uncharacterized protein n=1 Tax=uncultured Parcubacteria bacterium Rifle_16ft_4_minimus_13933 TaxID=1665134 RepID=A0A0H4T0H7_9BACT|nr:hypothetical protein [uncultured Parcubacteria bacterium Rifle_16ft_4_minimus_13933]
MNNCSDLGRSSYSPPEIKFNKIKFYFRGLLSAIHLILVALRVVTSVEPSHEVFGLQIIKKNPSDMSRGLLSGYVVI